MELRKCLDIVMLVKMVLFLAASSVSGTIEPISLEYRVYEEQSVGMIVGNLQEDAKLAELYDGDTTDRLRFRFLSDPSEYFDLSLTTGDIVVKKVIDREAVCPAEDTCEIKMDIAIQPAEYFRIIKVTVNLLDINDHSPTFPENSVRFDLSESDAPGTSLPLPAATDLDSPEYGIAGYRLLESDPAFRLFVETKMDGAVEVRLVLAQSLDREVREEYFLQVVAFDSRDQANTLDIYIKVRDANDHTPMFTKSNYNATIKENIAVGSSIVQVQAYDRDSDSFGRVTYRLSPRSQERFGSMVEVEEQTGVMTVAGLIDYEEDQSLILTVEAFDNGGVGSYLASEAAVIITILDENDNDPEMAISTLTNSPRAQVLENEPEGTFVAYLTVRDPDEGAGGDFQCDIFNRNFVMVPFNDGEFNIVSNSKFDREQQADHVVTVRCTDRGDPPRSSSVELHVDIKDVNDNTPRFSQARYSALVLENNYLGAAVAHVNATDDDEGDNAAIEYALSLNGFNLFNVNETTGLITAASSFDREAKDAYQVYVIARDRGNPQLSSSVLLNINILDTNDQGPVFTQDSYLFNVSENEGPGVEVGQVLAYDVDSVLYNGHDFKFKPSVETLSSSNPFNLNPITGTITTKRSLDREEMDRFEMEVVATDSADPRLVSVARVVITVTDRNDMPPIFVFPSKQNDSVRLPVDAPKGYSVTRIKVKDGDTGNNSKLVYSLTSTAHGLFSIDPGYGVLKLEAPLSEDIDLNSMLSVDIMVRDSGYPVLTATSRLHIVVVPGYALSGGGVAGITAGDEFYRNNLVIVIILGVISGIIMISLIIAIAFICRYNRRKRRRSHGAYNCREKEAMRRKHKNASTASDERTLTADCSLNTTASLSNHHPHPCQYKELVVDYEKETGSVVARPCSHTSLATVNSKALKNPLGQSSEKSYSKTISFAPSCHTGVTDGESSQYSGGVTNNESSHCTGSDLRVSHLQTGELTTRRAEDEGPRCAYYRDRTGSSGQSSDVESGDSNPDSGKGPSEEGDGQAIHDFLYRGGFKLTPPVSESSMQIVPEMAHMRTFKTPSPRGQISAVRSPNSKSCLKKPDSDTSNPWVKRDYLKSPTKASKYYDNSGNPSQRSLCTADKGFLHESHDGSGLFTGSGLKSACPSTVPIRMKKKYPMEDIQASYLDYQSSRSGNHSDNGHMQNTPNQNAPDQSSLQDSYRTPNDSSIQYSCTDVSEALRDRTDPRGDRCIPEEDEDGISSTSGSYVVDPQELCNVIERKFFEESYA